MEDSVQLRIRKGQAFNLAIQQAIHEGSAEDTRRIYSLFIKFYELANLVQNASIDDLKEALGCNKETEE